MAPAYVALVTRARPEILESPVVLRTCGWRDYGLVDSGDGRKLERYGQVRVVRPEPQCLWRPALNEAEWAKADAVFDPADEDDAPDDTSWKSPSSTEVPLPSSSIRSKDPSAPTTSRISSASGLGLPDLGRHAASVGMMEPSGARTGI